MHTFSGRKRKHHTEDSNINCVCESARLKRTQGQKDSDQMNPSVEFGDQKDSDPMEPRVEYINQKDPHRMDPSVESVDQKDSDQMNPSVQSVEQNDSGHMDPSVESVDQKDSDQMNPSVQSVNQNDSGQMNPSVESVDQNDSVQMNASAQPVDRISQLPDHVIHHILSHLRNVKDAVRTSILSKKWRALWYSFSVLIFDERKFAARIRHEDGTKGFRDYVTHSLITHNAKKMYIQKLVVHMTSSDMEGFPYLDLWLSIAIYRNIKELDLHVGIKNSKRYTIPQIVFSSKTLTGIRLSRCKLETCDIISLPHLHKLYLHKLHLVESTFQNLISSCHSIEDLRIIKCSGLKHLQVSNLIQLNRAEIHYCTQLMKVEISAPNLETFWYCGKKTFPCEVSLEGCTSLKRLTLEHPQVTRDFCENKISNFPVLEKLELSMSNNKMKNIIISNNHLQKFTLKGCKKLRFVLVFAPNLVSFECKGETIPWLDMNPFHLTDAKLSFVPKSERQVVGYGDKIWINMKSFIEKFNPEGFKLVLYSNKNIIIHEDLNKVMLPPVADLGCKIIKSSACIDDILFSLLRTLHPVTLSIISLLDSKFPKSVYELMKKKDEDPTCCIYNAPNNKCWRHFLKDVNLDDLNDVKSVDMERNEDDKRTCAWYNWLKFEYATLECRMTNLRLCWNSHHDMET